MASSTDAAGRRDHALFHLLLATGLRLSSALALRVEDLDLASGEAAITTTKNSHPTQIYLGPKIVEHLKHFVGARSDGFVFASPNETPIDRRHAHRRFRGCLRRAAIDRATGPHVLRHTRATRLYQATHDILLVQAALGHRSIASTSIYARPDASRLRDVLASG